MELRPKDLEAHGPRQLSLRRDENLVSTAFETGDDGKENATSGQRWI
jgi:hypothetical protein